MIPNSFSSIKYIGNEIKYMGCDLTGINCNGSHKKGAIKVEEFIVMRPMMNHPVERPPLK